MNRGLFKLSLLVASSLALLSSGLLSSFEAGMEVEAEASSSSSLPSSSLPSEPISQSSITCRVLFPAISGSTDLEGYYSYVDDEAGGYYGELLNYLGDLSSINMVYVVPKDETEWNDMFVSFMDGTNTFDLDLMVNLNESAIKSTYPSYDDVISFSTRTDLRNPLYLVTQDSNNTISEFDLLTYEGAKVGLVKGSTSRNTPFYDWAKSSALYFAEGDARNKISVTVYDSAPLRDKAFHDGDIDIIIGGVSEEEYQIETRTLISVTAINSFLGVRKSKTGLFTALDASLIKMHDSNEDLFTSLRNKHFPTHYDKLVLNKEEEAFCDRVSYFTVGYEGDFFPFIHEENGLQKGFLPSYMSFFSDYIQTNYNTSFDTHFIKKDGYDEETKKELSEGTIDFWWGRSSLNKADSSAYSLLDSDTYLTVQLNLVSTIASQKSVSEYTKIGVSFPSLVPDGEKMVEDGELIAYSDPKEMLAKVNSGELEAAIVLYDYLKYAKGYFRFDNLLDKGVFATSDLSFASSPNNIPLHTLLNKLIHYMNTSGQADTLYTLSADDYSYTSLTTDFLRNNLVLVVSIVIIIVALLIAIIVVLFILFSNKRKRAKELKDLSEMDPLGNIYNKKKITLEAEQLVLTKTPFSFYILDLNDFKSVNDGYGHLAGDEVLHELAERFSALAKETGSLTGRFGGDEFAFIDKNIEENRKEELAQKILETSKERVLIHDGTKMKIELSLGVASFPADASSADDIFSAADDSLYSVKETKSPGYDIFNISKEYKQNRRSLVKAKLEKALSEERVYMLFQPIVDIKEKKIVSFEALMRIKGEEGSLSPADFIPIAESVGLIKSLGEVALRKSLAFEGKLIDKGINVPVSVNISPIQMDDVTFASLIKSVLKDNPRVTPDHIIFELTASRFSYSPIKELRVEAILNQGIVLALDDFGTGYSSLKSLESYPYKYVKFNESLIDGDKERKNLTKLFDYVRGFGTMVVVERVESKAEVDYLRSISCRYAQGYIFSLPLNEEEAISFYKKGLD